MSLLLDTSGILVLLDRRHPLHQVARGLLRGQLLVPITVLPEVDHLARKHLGPGPVERFLQGLLRGEGVLLPLGMPELERTLELMVAHPEVGFVDASLVALAERHRVRRVLTLDRRHFLRFRPKGLEYLEVLP
ncbi:MULTISPECIES: type II toxin-antitoxin system VapC family toxin [Thermus]|uniref:type II toxin-antitoxin system VapC family toxin n=1 Tax=Thermus TaxID=270 RepID=UPI0010761EC8|nr:MULTISPECIES: PIN domain-containing protein [Thermus]